MSSKRFIEKLGEPDIRLAGLRIWVHGLESPEGPDLSEEKWLRATAECESRDKRAWVGGSFLQTMELAEWLDDLLALQNKCRTDALLSTVEPILGVCLEASNESRHVDLRVDLNADHVNRHHRFRFEIDRSDLPQLIDEVRGILTRFPVRGRR